MMDYPFHSIWINGRDISLQDILSKTVIHFNSFEQNVFTFIHDWMSDVDLFSLQTSGSTGSPKTLQVTRDQMIASAKMTEQALGLTTGTNALLCLDAQFIAGKMMLVRSFVTGMKIIAVTPSARFLSQIPDVRIELAAMVPYQIQEIIESENASKLNTIRLILAGGAPLNEATKSKLSHLTTAVYATYGMTETISHIALQRVNGAHAEDHFTALPGISLRLDERDCLVINAPHLPDEIITNDVCEIVGAYGFRWLGRWDNVINTGGIKVIPEKVEKNLSAIFQELGLTNEFFLIGMADQKLGERVSLIVKGSLTPYQKAEILELARKKIQIYAAPKEVHCLEQFHYTQTDKINRLKTVEMLPKQH